MTNIVCRMNRKGMNINMNELEKEFFVFLDERKVQTLSESSELANDGRKDESNVLKAKANIYDIFRAIWSASKNTTSDKDEFKKVFEVKTDTITAPWKMSLDKAKEHNDSFKVMIEEAKLSAVSEIKERINSML